MCEFAQEESLTVHTPFGLAGGGAQAKGCSPCLNPRDFPHPEMIHCFVISIESGTTELTVMQP